MLSRTIVAVLAMALWLTLAHAAGAQTIDLQAQRLAVTPIAVDWRFHPGDDPRWSLPGFDDTQWKLIQPATDWVDQGYSEQNGLAWFRFHLRVPSNTSSLVIQLPRIDKSYQLFADGRLIGQVGSLPPDRPITATGAPRLFTLPIRPSAVPQQITLALRVWRAPRLVGITADVLLGRAFAGDPAAIMSQFSLSKAASLLGRGSAYTQAVIVVIVGTATLLLFWLTREDFYVWFALNMLFLACDLPLHLAAQHFAWNFLSSIYAFILLDLLAGVTFAFFLLGALNLRRPRLVLLVVGLTLLAELGPVLLTADRLPLTWADGIYFVFNTAVEVLLASCLMRGWRAGLVDAKLLFLPYMIGVVLACAGNLGHLLIELNVPHAQALLIGGHELLHEPFAVTVEDIGDMLSLLGLLAVLVLRFARTSRDQQRLAAALQAAHDIQHRLVPVDLPRLGGLHTEVVYLAAEEVGGDFCQVLCIPDGSLLIVIGDVSGKGLQAAMLGTLAVGALRSIADENVEPAEALHRLNRIVLRTDMAGFITCLCLKLSPSGEVTLANAGHLSPYLDGTELQVESGLPLGVVPEIEYQQSRFRLPATARLTLLSDGVVEARSRTGELFGFERTSEISQRPASEIAAAAHKHGQEDDITIITLDWRLPVAELAPA